MTEQDLLQLNQAYKRLLAECLNRKLIEFDDPAWIIAANRTGFFNLEGNPTFMISDTRVFDKLMECEYFATEFEKISGHHKAL